MQTDMQYDQLPDDDAARTRAILLSGCLGLCGDVRDAIRCLQHADAPTLRSISGLRDEDDEIEMIRRDTLAEIVGIGIGTGGWRVH